MSALNRVKVQLLLNPLKKTTCSFATRVNVNEEQDNFKPLNLKHVRNQFVPRTKMKPLDAMPPRSNQMPIEQYWGNVWPGPRTFHPATVPLPMRQGYIKKGAPPNKFGNAELMKIPNFLHLTPPVIKKQCETLKKFCTPWPKNLDMEETYEKIFPVEIISSDYCHSSPTIRDPLARIVTIKFKFSNLDLDKHAKDKFLRLVGERYNEKTDTVTIVTDRCPTKKQNYDYAMYLLTAVYHESWRTEAWEKDKADADMEYYDWSQSVSKKTVELIFKCDYSNIPHIEKYIETTQQLMNEGENNYTLNKYNDSVRKLFNLPTTENIV